MKKILVIDDDTYICELLVSYLGQNGFRAEGAVTGKKGMHKIENDDFDLVLCDYRLPDSDGLKILQFVKSKNPRLPLIIMTAYTELKLAVKLIKAGAYDYVTKPIQHEEILQLVRNAINSGAVKETNSSFSKEFVLGSSPDMQKVMEHVKLVAPTELTVLIEGETGSGKEYIARAIHYASRRKDRPFIAVDCGAIPKELANSELFGHIKGAFTGAINDKKGYFELALGGTLFLDEVGNLPYENQVKILRALQERIISRVGDNKDIKTDIRLIAATHEDLLTQLEKNEFREDLYHRLNEFKIQLPALRERAEDIMVFTGFFINKANKAFNKKVSGIDDSVKELFLNYEWHGNIRELKNVINRAVLLSEGNIITADVLPDEIRMSGIQGSMDKLQASPSRRAETDLKEATEITEKEVILNALLKSNFNKTRAARMLNIDRKTLYNKIKLYKIKIMK